MKKISTLFSAPTGAPRNLRLLGDTNETSAWITWEDPPCEDKLGSFKNYVIKVIPVMSVMMIPQSFSTTKPLLLLSGLLSNTTYAVSVAFENTVGVGPQTSLHFKTAVPGEFFNKPVLISSVIYEELVTAAHSNDHSDQLKPKTGGCYVTNYSEFASRVLPPSKHLSWMGVELLNVDPCFHFYLSLQQLGCNLSLFPFQYWLCSWRGALIDLQ